LGLIDSDKGKLFYNIDTRAPVSKNRPVRNSLLVLQTWLEQFNRTNGGSSLTDYSAEIRVRLLQTLQGPML
jgi:hypothetical protein